MSIPNVVIDTNVLVSAQRSRRGVSAYLVSRMGTGLFKVHLSVPLALEYEAVLMRQRGELNLSYLDVTDLVDAVCSLSQHHNIHFLWQPSLPDEKDEMILELAVAAQCEYIITYNQRDFRGADQFGLKILKPHTFLQRIGVLP